MSEIISKLFDWMVKYGVTPSIYFGHWIGEATLFIQLDAGEFRIKKVFRYVPSGEDTFKNFMFYNPQFDLEIKAMVKELIETYNDDRVLDGKNPIVVEGLNNE